MPLRLYLFLKIHLEKQQKICYPCHLVSCEPLAKSARVSILSLSWLFLAHQSQKELPKPSSNSWRSRTRVFWVFVHRPQHRAGNLVHPKPTSAELQTELKSMGRQDSARASDLPLSHYTEEPEPGRGPRFGPQTTALSPIPPPALFQTMTPSTHSTCVKAAKNTLQAQKRARPYRRQPLFLGPADGRPNLGWADEGDCHRFSGRKMIWVPSIGWEAPERSPKQRPHIKCRAHVFQGEKILCISFEGLGAEKGIFSPGVF